MNLFLVYLLIHFRLAGICWFPGPFRAWLQETNSLRYPRWIMGRPSSMICKFRKEHGWVSCTCAETHLHHLSIHKESASLSWGLPFNLNRGLERQGKKICWILSCCFQTVEGQAWPAWINHVARICEYMRQIQKSVSIVDRTRAAFIINCAHNFKSNSRSVPLYQKSSKYSEALQQHDGLKCLNIYVREDG